MLMKKCRGLDGSETNGEWVKRICSVIVATEVFGSVLPDVWMYGGGIYMYMYTT